MGHLAGQELTGDFVDVEMRLVVRDRDTKHIAGFDEVVRAEGARIRTTPFRTLSANAYAERVVRTVRSECLDGLLVANARHLERVLRSYAEHYNAFRPHQDWSNRSLQQHRALMDRQPCLHPPVPGGSVDATDSVG